MSISSCKEKSQSTNIFNDSYIKDTFHLSNGRVIQCDSLLIRYPTSLKFHPDSFLIIQDFNTEYLLKIIDLKSSKVKNKIPLGKGPGELLISWNINITDGILYDYCPQLKKFITLAPDNNRDFQILGEIHLQEKYASDFTPLTKDQFACLSMADSFRITLINGKGESVHKMGGFPSIQSATGIVGDNDIFQSAIIGSTAGDKIALACRKTDFIEIYDLNKDSFIRIQGPLGLQYTVIDHGIAKSVTPRFSTYTLMYANNQEFWASYNGFKHKNGEVPPILDQYPKHLYCFNWEGYPLRKISLDYPFAGFDIDWDKKILYTIEIRNLEYYIIEYQLDNLVLKE